MIAPQKLIIASRKSALALWQAEHVRTRLHTLYPQCEINILGLTTEGDQRLEQTLANIGGKGLFIKELEHALERGEADLAVHSMKDMPMNLPEGFTLAAILAREDPRDALISNRYKNLHDMPPGARLGTSSVRRASQIKIKFPHIDIQPLRGNVQTRLAKLDRNEFDAIILAAAGLRRLGLVERITSLLDMHIHIPAVGQGALGIECLTQRVDVQQWMAPLNDEDTQLCVDAERTVSRLLAGSCQAPLAAHAYCNDSEIYLEAFVANLVGTRCLNASHHDARINAQKLAEAVAQELAAKGAHELLTSNNP